MSEEMVDELMVLDSAEKQIKYGDIIKRKNGCGAELHGEYGYYQVIKRGGFPVLSYVMSEKGYVLPPDYLACHLSDLYDPKDLVWVSEEYMPMPGDEEFYVIPECELPHKLITDEEWMEMQRREQLK